MLCWLAFGEHGALKGAMKRARILIPAEGKPTLKARIFPTESRVIALRRPPWEAQMLCWLTFGEHEALKRDLKRVGILIPA